jgi:hypothetical protein
MPWQNVTPMEEIIRFVSLAQTDRFTITDLCEQFAIRRKTAHRRLEPDAADQSEGARPLWAGLKRRLCVIVLHLVSKLKRVYFCSEFVLWLVLK